MAFVLDCSVTMAWVFPDEASKSTDALRDSLVNDFAVVPVLWPIEVGNVLLVATRRRRMLASEWPGVRADLELLPIEIDSESCHRVLSAVLPMAYEHKLSVYDAMYLELALRRALPLATLDRELGAAGKAAGVEVLRMNRNRGS
jgi:predicted nucleic acid-binding protein